MIDSASDGLKAVDCVKRLMSDEREPLKYSLIFMDINMPEMDGV